MSSKVDLSLQNGPGVPKSDGDSIHDNYPDGNSDETIRIYMANGLMQFECPIEESRCRTLKTVKSYDPKRTLRSIISQKSNFKRFRQPQTRQMTSSVLDNKSLDEEEPFKPQIED